MNKKKDIIGELTDAPNEKYQIFFNKFDEINSLEPNLWKIPHLIGYFCKKYYDTYNIKYKFKFNSPFPSKCFEVFQIKKLASVLTAKPELLKDYIDWVYNNKVIKAKRRLTSISFMTVEGIVNEYKFNILLNQNNNGIIKRSTLLPDKYKNVFVETEFSPNTYGDLAFLYQILDMPKELVLAFEKIKSIGFDISILNKVL